MADPSICRALAPPIILAPIILVAAACASVAFAQDMEPAAAANDDAAGFFIPALTPIEIAIDADLGSKISVTGQTFPIHLAGPISVNGREVIPAGATGEGEVIHAKKAGGSGAPGELVLAARHLVIGGKPLKLRSMRVGLVGGDAVNGVAAFNAATAATPLPIGIIGFAVTGRNVIYPRGTVATAKTAELFVIEADVGATASERPTAIETLPGNGAGAQEGENE